MTVLEYTIIITIVAIIGFLIAMSKRLSTLTRKQIVSSISMIPSFGVITFIILWSFNDFNNNYISTYTNPNSVDIVSYLSEENEETITAILYYDNDYELELFYHFEHEKFSNHNISQFSLTNKDGKMVYFNHNILKMKYFDQKIKDKITKETGIVLTK